MQTDSTEPITTGDRFLLIGGFVLLGAGIIEGLGAQWDIQWHTVVGPDTFFTAPHLMLYIGIAAGGFTALAVVLRNTFAGPGRDAVTGHTVRVFGTFAAPVGFLIAGLGAAGQLLYGLSDLWWHEVYGFDATLTSPPHIAMSLCSMTTAIGGVVVFAALRRYRAGRLGLVLATANVLSGMVILVLALLPFMGWTGFVLATIGVATMGPMLVAAVLRAPWWPILTGLIYSLLLALAWVFAPWATAAYAASVGLPMRDFADNSVVQLVLLEPWGVLLGALLLELGLRVARSRNIAPRRAVPVLGALLAVALTMSYAVQLNGAGIGAVIFVGSLPVGAVAGWLAWYWGAGLRRLDATGQQPTTIRDDLVRQEA
ncbi:MAG: hypothetical protein ACRDTG_11135 [Pseudonocardiaceae bacterium]